mmetsp:Transcript_47301/g.143807  ORF Transcript_47301/g.143807 Transcript_47301/m.143807 type:complete len:407 (-) Transcript_47301:101-1321(-)
MSIDTASGLIGFLDPLETLHEVLTDEQQQGKLFDLSSEFGGWRRCKGDGNCFYRAYGFALVEAILSKSPKSLAPLAADLGRPTQGETQDLLGLMKELSHLDGDVALETWYQALLIDESLDAQLVRAVRMACADWLMQNEDAEFSGMRVGSFVQETNGMDLQTFRRVEVLTNGKEAELLMIHAATCALGFGIEIIQLDRSPGAPQRYTLPDLGRGGEPMATLLFRPGHYDIFYRRQLFKELAQMEEKFNLRRSCGRRGAAGGPSASSASGIGADPWVLEDIGHNDHLGRGAMANMHGASFEAALGALRRTLRETIQDCTAVLDREAAKATQAADKVERDRARCIQLREDIVQLTALVTRKKEALQEHTDAVNRLRGCGFWGCCAGPVAPAAALPSGEVLHTPASRLA